MVPRPRACFDVGPNVHHVHGSVRVPHGFARLLDPRNHHDVRRLRFDADNSYTYREGKRLVRLLGDELQKRADLHRIGVDPRGARRDAITGRSGSAVWDLLALKAARGASTFTAYPHLTLSLRRSEAEAAITIPNGVPGGFRTRLRDVGEKGFFSLVAKIEERVRPTLQRSKGSKALVYALQRHYRSQRSRGEEDARLDVPANDRTRQAEGSEIATRMDAGDLRRRHAQEVQYSDGIRNSVSVHLFRRAVASGGRSGRWGMDSDVTDPWFCARRLMATRAMSRTAGA